MIPSNSISPQERDERNRRDAEQEVAKMREQGDVFVCRYINRPEKYTATARLKALEEQRRERAENKAIRDESLALRAEIILGLPTASRQAIGSKTFDQFVQDKLAEEIDPNQDKKVAPQKADINWDAKFELKKPPAKKKEQKVRVREGFQAFIAGKNK